MLGIFKGHTGSADGRKRILSTWAGSEVHVNSWPVFGTVVAFWVSTRKFPVHHSTVSWATGHTDRTSVWESEQGTQAFTVQS